MSYYSVIVVWDLANMAIFMLGLGLRLELHGKASTS
jgi:hypothetical protein